MKRSTAVLALFAIAVLAAPVLCAQDQPAARADRARFDAQIKGDVAALSELLSPDLTYVHSTGLLETRDEFIEAIRSGKYKYKQVVVEDLVVREYGDTALVSGKATIDVNSSGNEIHTVLRFLDVWVKRDGKWRMTAWQSTRLTP